MDPVFNDIFIKTVTGNYVDVYPAPENGKQIPSTFNEELFVDYVIENYNKDTAVAVLSQHIGEYQNYFTFQPLITEFECEAHKKSDTKDNISGADLNLLWTNISKEYRSDSIEYYEKHFSFSFQKIQR